MLLTLYEFFFASTSPWLARWLPNFCFLRSVRVKLATLRELIWQISNWNIVLYSHIKWKLGSALLFSYIFMLLLFAKQNGLHLSTVSMFKPLFHDCCREILLSATPKKYPVKSVKENRRRKMVKKTSMKFTGL